MNALDKLNILASRAGYNDITPSAIKIEDWGNKTSTTLVFDKEEDSVFMLNPIVAVPIKHVMGEVSKVPTDYKGVVAIHRAAISPGVVSRIKSVEDLKTTLQPIINAGIVDLINQVGFFHPIGFKISMEIPGREGIYFSEFENSTGYEFRLVLTKE